MFVKQKKPKVYTFLISQWQIELSSVEFMAFSNSSTHQIDFVTKVSNAQYIFTIRTIVVEKTTFEEDRIEDVYNSDKQGKADRSEATQFLNIVLTW